MTYPARGAAHLATVLAVLLAMVAVAATGAKPMPSPPAPLNASAFSSSEDYYYDYYDYEYDVAPPNLNLSEFRLPGEEGGGAPHIPRYMLELYNDQATRRSHPLPGADLVRSFEATAMDNQSEAEEHQDSVPTRVHYLGFNVTLHHRERVTRSTLRLYALITRDQYAYIGVERRVRVVMKQSRGSSDAEGDAETVTVCQRDVYEMQNVWETFDVTSAVRYWLANPDEPQVLQILIESVFSTVGDGGDLDVATVPHTDIEPLLLVYSSVRHRRQSKEELDQMISHEYDNPVTKRQRRALPPGASSRARRAKRETGTDPRLRRVRRNTAAEEQEEESNQIWEGEQDYTGLPSHAHNSIAVFPPAEGRRKGKRRRAKNACKRKPLKVDFEDIGWHKWIIAPPSYEAYQCSGKCFYPLPSHLSPTKHAVVQNLVHSLHPDRASRACCVPTLLGPISLLYLENNIPTYKYDYDDMVVLECGCR
ncbi:bone morphogenetic protein 10-like isoform X1 [Penaeus chinensis]|uniref:bone morphogenetic protein 10-like isoform X1 n=1 Tax=Penaeus chinensis TaxID=139456 RepID=UPI001FB77FFB|nr:bone morphogenetic protein 10-like isoform X1 [Penaeus chinensis]